MKKTPTKSTAPTLEKIENINNWLLEKKAQHLVAVDLSHLNAISESMVVVSATSMRHAQGLADFILAQAKEQNYEFLHMEGYQNGLWILLDFNDILVNILQPEQRELYRLEELYPEAVVLRDDRA